MTETPKGYRKLKEGEVIQGTDIYYSCGDASLGLLQIGACVPGDIGREYNPDFHVDHYRKLDTPKPKETKTMTTKKPGTTHGKPTAKGMKAALAPKATKKPKYPAAREAVGIMIPDYRNPKSKATKAELVDQIFDLLETATEARKDLATTGTKLDRAIVDLKEARAKIKELSK